MRWRNQKRCRFGSQHSCNSQQGVWSAAASRKFHFSWAPRRLRSQTPHLALCCSAAPQTAAWTGWPEAASSVASHLISGQTTEMENLRPNSCYGCCHTIRLCWCAQTSVTWTSTDEQSRFFSTVHVETLPVLYTLAGTIFVFFWFISEYQTTMKSRNIWQLIIKTVLFMDYFESLLKPIIFMQLGLIP